MKKLFLVVLCAFASFAFADNSSLELRDVEKHQSACDGHGGVVTIHMTVNCDGDSTPEFQGTIQTCADQALALIEQYQSFCD